MSETKAEMRAKLVKQYIKIASECINGVCAHEHLCTCTCISHTFIIELLVVVHCINIHVYIYMVEYIPLVNFHVHGNLGDA